MKKIVLLVIVAFTATQINAQDLDFGIKAGANFSTLNDAKDLDNKTGLQAGIFLGVKFNDNFAIQPEVLYSQQGADSDFGDFNLDYINVPVMLKYYLIGGLNVQVGPQFGFVINDDLPNADGIEEKLKTNDFDFSAAAGLGLDLPLGLRVDARYNFGITDISDDFKGKNGVFSVALGYSFL